MIVFTPIIKIPDDILINLGIKKIITYNLTSYISDFQTLNMLIPSNFMEESIISSDISSNSEFDAKYSHGIITNENSFLQLMTIVVPAYMDPDTMVHILIGPSSDFRDNIAESLAKLVQQRYGYSCYFVYELEDFYYLDMSSCNNFSIPGLFILDKDLERWRMLTPQGSEVYDTVMEEC